MEQARYWMWAKRKHATLMTPPAHNHHQVPDDNSSWEEQAFAEDAAGPLGGCIWPPRSYSCTFCRREFRSAQALGGHMNVHRRDRARLKQSSPNDQNVETALHHHHDRNHHHQDNNISLQINPSISTSTLATFRQHPSHHHHHHQVCAAVVYNPSSDPSSSTSPASRVSEAHQLLGRHYHQEQIPIPSSRTSSPPPPSSRSILTANRYYINDNNCVARIKPQGADKISRIVESAAGSTCRANKVATDLSVSLNLVVRCSRPPSAEDDDEAISTCKRRRVATEIKQQSNSKGCSLPFFLKSEGFEELLSSNRPAGSIEELDLELRLGDRPKQVIKVVEK